MKRMEWNGGRQSADAQDDALCASLLKWLDGMKPGRRLRARDGTPFMRINRTCICFCNLRDGSLCSARDICRCNGGVATDELNVVEEIDYGWYE